MSKRKAKQKEVPTVQIVDSLKDERKNRPKYKCPKCNAICRIDCYNPGRKSCWLTCNHVVRVADLKKG